MLGPVISASTAVVMQEADVLTAICISASVHTINGGAADKPFSLVSILLSLNLPQNFKIRKYTHPFTQMGECGGMLVPEDS